MLGVPFVLVVAAAAILAGVVVVAMGRGGELTLFHRDLPAAGFRLRTAADVALLRLPTGLFGYQQQVTSDVLRDIADLLASQEAEIASLRDEVWRLNSPLGTGSVSVEPGVAAQRDRALEQPPPL
jgi:hypothetical protein